MGCYAYDPNDYDDFKTFFKVALEKYHHVNLNKKKHVNNWSLKGAKGLPKSGVLNFSEIGIMSDLSMRVRTGRNLNKYPLPGAMSK